MSVCTLLEAPVEFHEEVHAKENLRRVLICNAAGEAVGCVHVPDGGALVIERRD